MMARRAQQEGKRALEAFDTTLRYGRTAVVGNEGSENLFCSLPSPNHKQGDVFSGEEDKEVVHDNDAVEQDSE